jgi:hypothetical protein
MEYFQKKKVPGFMISAFTQKDCLEEFLRSHSIEILLVGDQASPDGINSQNVRYIYQLTDHRTAQLNHDIPTVFKYQPAKTVIEEITNDYASRENVVWSRNNPEQVRIISIFSPVPGMEKITFSWSLSTLLSEKDKVLLIPMELYPLKLPFCSDKADQSLTDFIYYLKAKSNITGRLKMLPQSFNNLSVLSGIVHAFDLLALSREDIQLWVNELRTNTEYTAVVFYIGYYTEAIEELIKLSDTVLLAISENPFEAEILKEWQRQSEQTGIGANQNKLQYIELQKEDNTGNIPASINELANCSSWDNARQYLCCS